MHSRYVIALLLTLILTHTTGCKREAIGPVVQTASGAVQGFLQEDVHVFYGIPYAAAPVADLRWKPPVPAVPWDNTLAAIDTTPLCFQYMLYMQRGVEDCLRLNVWTPDVKPQKPLPVMVWIHGGGFIGGDGLQGSPGHRLAKHGNVVIVSMNYRLGALGFLAHQALSAEGRDPQGNPSSGNYGLMDQQAALHWVRQNIDTFGGDPDNITIFGESAGGMSVCAHLASPQSTGLFKQAIIQSGPCGSDSGSLYAAEQQGEKLAHNIGCDGQVDAAACLRSKTPEDILKALPNDPAFVFGEGEYGSWMPTVDGRVLKEPVYAALAAGRFNRVPVINGGNGDEGTLLVMFSHEYRFAPLKADKYLDRIRYIVGNDETLVEGVRQRYPLANYPDPGEALAQMFGDGSMLCSIQKTSEALQQWTPTYAYTFTYPNATFILPEARKLKAFHGAEIQYIFNVPWGWFEQQFSGDELAISTAMMDYWSQFARTGNPNLPAQMKWPVVGDNQTTLLFDRQLTVENNFRHDTCAFWNELGVHRRPLHQYETEDHPQ